jgi:biotin carboxyl carrier protein
MKLEVKVGGEPRRLDLQRGAGGWECRLEGDRRKVDVVEVAPGVFSLLVEGESFTLHVERVEDAYRVHARGADLTAAVENPRRWIRNSRGALGRAGRQEVSAPMPGKVVRVLVEEGETVESHQGLVVVEAMKMQNEIPSPKAGVVERVLVREGDTVEHGQGLVVVG